MNFFGKYQSPFGYQNGDNGVDSYGVDHSGFSTQDELQYQTLRTNRENELANDMVRQGIAQCDYPQYVANFWQNASLRGGGLDIASISPTVQAALNLAKNNPTNESAIQYAQNVLSTVMNDGNQEANIDYSLYGNDFSQSFIDQMLADNRFQQAMNRTRANEGGYVNHPNDRGGATNYGISSRIYPDEDIENMTRERADAIYYRDYWLKPKINQLPDELAGIVFDDGVVQGQPTAIMNLQKALGVKADGIIGSDTLGAVRNTNYKAIRTDFINNVNRAEDEYLKKDPSQIIFERGHRKRYNEY